MTTTVGNSFYVAFVIKTKTQIKKKYIRSICYQVKRRKKVVIIYLFQNQFVRRSIRCDIGHIYLIKQCKEIIDNITNLLNNKPNIILNMHYAVNIIEFVYNIIQNN
eukprot:457201_1